jgi:hypothetical protein
VLVTVYYIVEHKVLCLQIIAGYGWLQHAPEHACWLAWEQAARYKVRRIWQCVGGMLLRGNQVGGLGCCRVIAARGCMGLLATHCCSCLQGARLVAVPVHLWLGGSSICIMTGKQMVQAAIAASPNWSHGTD